MQVEVKLFAVFRERAKRDSIEIELPEPATVADALGALGEEDKLGDLVERMPVRVAVNREYVADDSPIADGDELALIPPVSGGAHSGAGLPPEPHALVSAEPLSLDAVTARVGDPGAGAIVSFQGVTRDVARLEYEAYAEMAEPRMREILLECATTYGLLGIAAEHRTGSVPLGEPSVIVAASSAHRDEAFAGAREAIDRIKAEAPIWKKEVEAGGEERWVEGTVPK
ncbi:molybdenum cofactor biosynthesis protein MoaE [soil metagenome]